VADDLQLTELAKAVAVQLFLQGPTWDGNIIDKTARDELRDKGLATRSQAYAWLTYDGVVYVLQRLNGHAEKENRISAWRKDMAMLADQVGEATGRE